MKSANLEFAGRVAPKQQHYWDWRAAANFMAGGAGGGLLVLAAAASFAASEARAPIFLGMALIAAGLACAWFETGRPWRALNVLRHFGSSWMSCEAAIAPLLFAIGGLALFGGQRVVVVAAGVLGAAFLYAQARILAADKGIPAWRHPRCLPLVVATGLTEGAGVLALCSPLLPSNAVAGVALALLALLLIRAFLWKRYLAGLRDDGAPQGSLRALSAVDVRLLMLGHVLPAVLVGAAALAASGGASLMIIANLMGAAGLLSVGGGWMLKHTLILRAAFTQGFALEHLPVRGRGAAGAAGKPGWGGAA